MPKAGGTKSSRPEGPPARLLVIKIYISFGLSRECFLRCNDESVLGWLDLRIRRHQQTAIGQKKESPDRTLLRWIHGTSNLTKQKFLKLFIIFHLLIFFQASPRICSILWTYPSALCCCCYVTSTNPHRAGKRFAEFWAVGEGAQHAEPLRGVLVVLHLVSECELC